MQGVGFRFTVCRLAAKHSGVRGYVRNVPDGTVEMIAEGKRPALLALLADVERTMVRHISQVDSAWQAPTGEFQGFDVHF